MLRKKLYYTVKPLLPRRLQIALRSRLVLRKRAIVSDIWPIDEKAGEPPAEWSGWPDGKKFALVLTHDVDTARGQDKCLELMELDMSLGYSSSFNFVPMRYDVSPKLRNRLVDEGFEVGVHGLLHGGKYFNSRKVFQERAIKINRYIKEWNAVGYRSPSMQHNLEWFHDLDIQYDASTFDTDPFEPQPDGMGTIFPFYVNGDAGQKGYVELPYTLPQDFTLFVLMREQSVDIWKRKLDWIAAHGGMALLNTHPDYLNYSGAGRAREEYPARYYSEFLEYIKSSYKGEYWHALPRDVARFWNESQRIEKELS